MRKITEKYFSWKNVLVSKNPLNFANAQNPPLSKKSCHQFCETNKNNFSIRNKKADINLSFGVIFSIILIMVFVFAAIYAINFFLNYQKCLQVGRFYDDLQREISQVYMSSSTENKPFQISLPKNIEMVCFANLSATITNPGSEYDEIRDFFMDDLNLFLIPGESACSIPYKKIRNINVSEITKNQNPYCVFADDVLILNKKTFDRSVLIE